jgi:hypothetical protein
LIVTPLQEGEFDVVLHKEYDREDNYPVNYTSGVYHHEFGGWNILDDLEGYSGEATRGNIIVRFFKRMGNLLR